MLQTKENQIVAKAHHLKGKTAAQANKTIKSELTAALHVYFAELEEMGSPRAIRVVRDKLGGFGIRDDDVDIIELATSVSKCGLYKRFCNGRGWDPQTDSIGKMEMVPMDGQDQQQVPSWPTFLDFWKVNYLKLIVPKARQVICGDCWMFANSFQKLNRSVASNGEDDVVDKMNDYEVVQAEYEMREAEINRAKLHVERADAQRKGFNELSERAKSSRAESKPRSEHYCTIVVDYSQNLGLPHLGAEQAGESYYYCPLNVNGFGIVDQGTGKLVTYIYDEGEGGKCGNNVTSLIHKYLMDFGMLDINDPIVSLDIVMDNCAGQNKNCMVLRYLVWLREMGYFTKTQG